VGYFPGIASINNYPVYIENCNGNSNIKYKQAETLKRAYLVNNTHFVTGGAVSAAWWSGPCLVLKRGICLLKLIMTRTSAGSMLIMGGN